MCSQLGMQGIIDCWWCYVCGFGVFQCQLFFIVKEWVLLLVSYCQQFIVVVGVFGDFYIGDIYIKFIQVYLCNVCVDK